MTRSSPERNEAPRLFTRITRGNALGCLPLLATLIFGVVACAGFYRELSPIVLARESQKWPSAKGHVMEATTLYFQEQKSKREGFYPAGYRYHVLYTYTVADKSYRNDRLRFTSDHEIFRDERSARSLIADFKPGATILVYYDSSNPAISTLMHDYRFSYTALGYCFLFTVLAILSTLGAYLTAKKNSKPAVAG